MKYQKGFGLVETLIVTALLVVITFGVTKSLERANFISKTADFKRETSELAKLVFDVLSDKDACYNTLNSMDAASTTGVTEIRNAANEVVYDMNTVHGKGVHGKGVQFLSMELVDQPGTSDGVNFYPGSVGSTNLMIKFQKMSGTANVNREAIEMLKIWVQTDATSKIISCFALSSGENLIWRKTVSNPADIFYQPGNVGVGTSDPQAKLDVEGFIRATNAANDQISFGAGPLEYQFVLAQNKPLEFWNASTIKKADVEAGTITASEYLKLSYSGVACTPLNIGAMIYNPTLKRVQVCEVFGWKTKKVMEWCLPKEHNKDNDDEYMNFRQTEDARRPKGSRCFSSQRKRGSCGSWNPNCGRGNGPPRTSLDATGFRIIYDDDTDPCLNDQKCQFWKGTHQ